MVVKILALSLLQPGGLLLVWDEDDTRRDLQDVLEVLVTGLVVRYVRMGNDQCLLGIGAGSIVPNAYVEGGNLIVTSRHVFLGEAASTLFDRGKEGLVGFMTRVFHRRAEDYILLPQAMYHIDMYLLYVGQETFLLPHPDTLAADSVLATSIARTRDALRELSYTVCDIRYGFVPARVRCVDDLRGSFFNSLAGVLADGQPYLLCPSYGTTADTRFIREVRTYVHNAIVACVGNEKSTGLRCQTAYSPSVM